MSSKCVNLYIMLKAYTSDLVISRKQIITIVPTYIIGKTVTYEFYILYPMDDKWWAIEGGRTMDIQSYEIAMSLYDISQSDHVSPEDYLHNEIGLDEIKGLIYGITDKYYEQKKIPAERYISSYNDLVEVPAVRALIKFKDKLSKGAFENIGTKTRSKELKKLVELTSGFNHNIEKIDF